MSASPDFYYNPSAAPAFSPCASPPLLFATAGAAGAGAAAADLDYYCRTPTGAGISYLREPDTCPPAPRKPPPPPAACRKRLFNVDAISLRLDDLERIFRPSPPQPHCDKRPRSPDRAHDELSSNPASTSSSGASSVA